MFFHAESRSAVYIYIATEIKKLQPILMNLDPKHDSRAGYYDVIDTFFFEKFRKLFKLTISSRKLLSITSHKRISVKNFKIQRFSPLALGQK